MEGSGDIHVCKKSQVSNKCEVVDRKLDLIVRSSSGMEYLQLASKRLNGSGRSSGQLGIMVKLF